MRLLKKAVTTVLIASLTIVPVAAGAEGGVEIEEITEYVELQELNYEFIGFHGTIKEIQEDEGSFSILIENDNEEPQDKAIFNITDKSLLLSNKTMDSVGRDYLKEGMEVMAFYPSDIILPMIYPPRIPADVIAVMENEEHKNVELYKFDEELLSTDKVLQILPNEETIIVDREGNALEADDIKNSTAVVFYNIATLSLPAKANPEKVIVLEQRLKDMNKAIIDNNEVALDKPMYIGESGTVMVPIRQIAEVLGYEVKWNGENSSVEMTKGAHWFLLMIGEDEYNFAKMRVQLGAAPELRDSTTYVPVEFLELMGLNINIVYDGVLNINN